MQAVEYTNSNKVKRLSSPKTCGRKSTQNPQRKRDTLCSACYLLFDARDIKNGVCLWCLYDMGTLTEQPRPGAKTHKLTSADVLDILALRNQGLSYAAIAKRHNVTATTVNSIVDGKIWKKVTLPYLAEKQSTLEKGA